MYGGGVSKSVRCGIDLRDHCVRPEFVGVVRLLELYV